MERSKVLPPSHGPRQMPPPTPQAPLGPGKPGQESLG